MQDGHAYTGRRHGKVGVAENLAGFVAKLHLLLRSRRCHRRQARPARGTTLKRVLAPGTTLVVGHAPPPRRPNAERDSVLPRRRGPRHRVTPVPFDAGSGDRLVGGGDELAGYAPCRRAAVQRRHRHHRRAVRVGYNALRDVLERFRIDLGYDERNVRVHAPGGGVVDDNRADRCDLRREFPRSDAPTREERERRSPRSPRDWSSTTIVSPREESVEPAERSDAKNRMESTGKPVFVEELAHQCADLAGSSEDGDTHVRDPTGAD